MCCEKCLKKGDRGRSQVVISYTRGEDIVPGEEGKARVSYSDGFSTDQCKHDDLAKLQRSDTRA